MPQETLIRTNASSTNASQQNLVATQDLANSGSQVRLKRSDSGGGLATVTIKEWVTVLVLCFVNLINYMDRFTVAGILPLIQDDFKINNSQSGLLQTAFIISYMIFAPLFGYLGDRYNRKYIMSFGVFLWCMTTFIGSFMKSYGWFIFFRALVGVGEASYSTIAPTIISDLFVHDLRTKMLAMFYFAIPVGSGLGYIIGGETARLTGYWPWGLRITPILGIVAILLIKFLIRDPSRGEKEGGDHLASTSWFNDIKALSKNRSFMLSTAGFTCISFVTGALAWWAPTFIAEGLKLQYNPSEANEEEVAYKFGVIAMVAGLVGVPFGSSLAQKLREKWPNADPLICAIGLLISAPLIFFGAVFASSNSLICYTFIFFGQIALNLNWAIVADMLLYVVIPTRRSTAEAFQILFAHGLGDAGSPYLIGVISDALKTVILPNVTIGWKQPMNSTVPLDEDPIVEFRSLQYALFLTIFVEILGSIFFFLTAVYIEKDKATVDNAISDALGSEDNASIFGDEPGSSNRLINPD